MTPDAWRRGQLLVRGFYNQLGADIDLVDLHREATALATIERENSLQLFQQIVSVAASASDATSKQKLVKLLEEVWIPGLKEKREKAGRAENEELINFAKQTFKVQVRGNQVVGKFEDKPAKRKPNS